MIVMAASVWQVLSALAPLLAPLLSLLLVLVGRILWNHEQRLRDLERGGTRRSRTLYGDEQDAQQTGLSDDLNNLSDRVVELEQSVSQLKDEIQKMRDD